MHPLTFAVLCIIGLCAGLIVAGYVGSRAGTRNDMYVDGYIPQESGEHVRCVYDRKTTYINTGKGLVPVFTHYLHCVKD